jgi:hypothetical protein
VLVLQLANLLFKLQHFEFHSFSTFSCISLVLQVRTHLFLCLVVNFFLSSLVVRGVVCKKNVAHRRMSAKKEKPRIIILGGALEYQRVSNLLSSFDTLLQQVLPMSAFSCIHCKTKVHWEGSIN